MTHKFSHLDSFPEESINGNACVSDRLPSDPCSSFQPVYFTDRATHRLHRKQDLFSALLSLSGIVLIWLLSSYAHSTTQGMTEDMRNALTHIFPTILLLPIRMIEGLIVLAIPILLVVVLSIRKRADTIIETLIAALSTVVCVYALTNLLSHLPNMITGPLLGQSGSIGSPPGLNLVLTTLAVSLTISGESSRMRSIKYSWLGLILVAFLGVIRGSISLPVAAISLLLGRLIGSISRWIFGFHDRRASAIDIVYALLTIGITPQTIIRSDVDSATTPLQTWKIDNRPDDYSSTPNSPRIDNEKDRNSSRFEIISRGFRLIQNAYANAKKSKPKETRSSPEQPPIHKQLRLRLTIPTEMTTCGYTTAMKHPQPGSRYYAVWDKNDTSWDITILDPGRAITTTLREIWDNIRLRGISRWVSPSLKANAERSMLSAFLAVHAGVRAPEPYAMAQAGDSFLQAFSPLPPGCRLSDAPEEIVTDDILDDVWRQLRHAHSRAITHRNLSFDVLHVDHQLNVWLTDWNRGEVGSTDLNRHIDVAQLLVQLTLIAGKERAIRSAIRVLGMDSVQASAPLVQSAIMPSEINSAVRRTDTIASVRAAAMDDNSPQMIEPLRIQRFAPKTLISVAILMVVIVVVLGSLNFHDIEKAITSANPFWIIVIALFATFPWFGQAISLLALCTERIRFRDALSAQMAGSVVTIIAPAGLGPSAFNLRFLTKKKVPTVVALTTVAIQQISLFLTTILLLFLVLAVGKGISVSLPFTTIFLLLVVSVCIVLMATSIACLRRWLWIKMEPLWKQIYPRLLWLIGQPQRFAIMTLGNILIISGYIGAFWAALMAFGHTLDLSTIAVTYLASNSLGSVIPSPGGIGPIEAALTGGLKVAGIPVPIALSAAVLFRLVTFYGRIPFGWFAMRSLEKNNLV